MINPDLQPGKPVQTRSGLEAVIYAVHEGQEYTIHGAIKDEGGNWIPFARRGDGLINDDGITHPLDLLPVPKKLTGFVNVYEEFTAYCGTREDADYYALSGRIACIDLSQFEEGEGL